MRTPRGLLIAASLAALAGWMLAVAGCGDGSDDGGGTSGVLLENGGFEDGSEPWYSMDTSGWGEPFEVSAAFAHSGEHSALIKLRPPPEATLHRVFGVVQSLPPDEFPEVVSGFYRVENWQKGTPIQYLQFVVIAVPPDGAGNIQIRYPLAGTSVEPFRIDNAKFVFLSKEEPVTGQWVYFERNVADDFRQLWGSVPKNLKEIRVFFEARYDSATPITGNMSGDVYYDDLYAGSKAAAPTYEQPPAS